MQLISAELFERGHEKIKLNNTFVPGVKKNKASLIYVSSDSVHCDLSWSNTNGCYNRFALIERRVEQC